MIKHIKKIRTWAFVKALYRHIIRRKKHPLQKIRTKSGLNIERLGSDYGGWVFEVSEGELENCTIISAGLGQDASFDIEFAAKYNARVVIVDPTPRSIEYFNEIKKNIGRKRSASYVEGGLQPLDSYDLSCVGESNFTLIEKALWNKSQKIKFFLPKNTQHVSHSIVNYQNSYSQDTSYIEVEAMPLVDILKHEDLNLDDIPLVKLDIEGAEVEVIVQFLADGFFPRQILVEFDELNKPSKTAFERINFVHDALEKSGYECVYSDGQADFLYLHNRRLAS